MLSVFRTIRRKLIPEGKITDYAGYAVGEIILIVIGILIALQINTWSEDRQDRKAEREIISGLQNEFILNSKLLSEVKARLEKTESCSYQLMELMKRDAADLSEHDLDYLVFWSVEHGPFSPSNNVLTEVLQTGKLGLIRDRELKNSLFDWDRMPDNNQANNRVYIKFLEENLIPYLIDSIALKNIDTHSPMQWDHPSGFESGMHQIFQDRKFENIIDNLLYHISVLKADYESIELVIDDLVSRTAP